MKILQDFAPRADLAEISVCFLMDRESRVAHNAYTFIRFLTDPANSTLRETRNLTSRPETIKGESRMQFGARRFIVGAGDCARALISMKDMFELSLGSEKIKVVSPGEWRPPVAIDSAEDHYTESFIVQSVPGFRWQVERWSSKSSTVVQFEDPIRRDVWRRIKESLNVPVPYERLGNTIVTIESYISLDLITSSDCRRLGIRVLGARPHGATASVELSYIDGGDCTTLHSISDEFTVVSVAGPAQRCAVSLFTAEGQLLTKRTCSLTPKSEPRVDSEFFVYDRRDRDVEVHLPSGSRVRVNIAWQRRTAKGQVAQHEWDLQVERAPARRAQAVLLEQKKLLLYTGGAHDRARATADIKAFLHQYGQNTIQIWDPYFYAADALEFLSAASNSAANVQILTSLRADPNDLEYVVKWLKSPGRGIPAFANVEIRFDIGPAHDRFLICDGTCWQLGCSFNGMGACVSTIIEWPFAETVQAAFDRAWRQARKGAPPEQTVCQRMVAALRKSLKQIRGTILRGPIRRHYYQLVKAWRKRRERN